jgi:hypothetical protein
VGGAAVIKARATTHAKGDGAFYGAYGTDDAMVRVGVEHGHEVIDFGDAFRGLKTRGEDVGFGKIHLFGTAVAQLRLNGEAATVLDVEELGENCGGIEIGQAEKIDAGIGAD